LLKEEKEMYKCTRCGNTDEFIECVNLIKVRLKQKPEYEVLEMDWSGGEVIAVECCKCGYQENPYNGKVIIEE